MDAENNGGTEHCVTLEEDSIPSEAVVRAIAQAKDIDPLEMPALYDIMDPEAINAVYNGGEFSGVQFSFCGYEVSITSNGQISLQASETESR